MQLQAKIYELVGMVPVGSSVAEGEQATVVEDEATVESRGTANEVPVTRARLD
jgi:hypothetical protein